MSASSDYAYPYKDPHYATIAASIAGMGVKFPEKSEISFNIEFLKSRKKVPFFKRKNKLKFKAIVQKKKAPLVFIISGLGGSVNSGMSSLLGKLYYELGFNILMIPSPSNWRYILAKKKSGMVETTYEDTKELYKVMELALKKAKRNSGMRVSKYFLAGYSLGALHSAYLAKIDKNLKKFNFQNVLMLNTPVDLYDSVDNLGRMIKKANRYSFKYREAVLDKVYFTIFKFMENPPDPSVIFKLNEHLKLSPKQSKIVTALDFQDSLVGMLLIHEYITKDGILGVRDHNSTRGFMMASQEAKKLDFIDYFSKITFKNLSQREGEQRTFHEVIYDMGLRPLEDFLKTSKNIFLIHNEDDYIMKKHHFPYLKEVFKERAFIFPNGGHVGNIWHPYIQKLMAKIILRAKAQM